VGDRVLSLSLFVSCWILSFASVLFIVSSHYVGTKGKDLYKRKKNKSPVESIDTDDNLP